jgi:hypothetical protein
VFLLSGTHIFGGNAAATGKIHIGGEGTLIWDANSLVNISNAGLGDVGAEGTVIGTGTAASVDIANGTFAPGDDGAAGIFTVTGPLTLENAAVDVLVNGTTAGSEYSQAKVSGPISLGTETMLNLTFGFTPGATQSFRIMDNTGNQPVTGTFAGLPEGAHFTQAGQPFSITYKGGTGNDVVVTALQPDPRPFKRIVPMLAAGN